MLNTSADERICGLSAASAIFRRRPSSRAAAMVTALASPIPLIFRISPALSLPSWPSELPAMASSSRARSRAELFLVPDPMRMANSSASLRLEGPLFQSRSRGLSSTAQSVIFIDMQQNNLSRLQYKKNSRHKEMTAVKYLE